MLLFLVIGIYIGFSFFLVVINHIGLPFYFITISFYQVIQFMYINISNCDG